MPSTERAGLIMDRLDAALAAAADPERAVAMRAYMREQFPFFGIPAPRQQQLARAVLAGTPALTQDDLVAIATACWARPQREYQYFACALLRRHARVCSAEFLDTAHHLITSKSWWDTVDALAAHVVGPLVAAYPTLVATMDEWSTAPDRWLIRTALLHQLRYRAATDAPRLFQYCAAQAAHPDFFVRKAIGWALREYGRTAPDAVRAFVHAHQQDLSPLSVREALKNL